MNYGPIYKFNYLYH